MGIADELFGNHERLFGARLAAEAAAMKLTQGEGGRKKQKSSGRSGAKKVKKRVGLWKRLVTK